MMLFSTSPPPQADTLGAFAPLLSMMGLALLIALLLNLWHFYTFDQGEPRQPPPQPQSPEPAPRRRHRRAADRAPDPARAEVSALVPASTDDTPTPHLMPTRQTQPRARRSLVADTPVVSDHADQQAHHDP